MMKKREGNPHFFSVKKSPLIRRLGKAHLHKALQSMYRIRHFETRAESAYQQGLIGGFFHAYTGQEAIQTSCVNLLGQMPWYATTYRCHALALLLGVTPREAMAELYGKSTGNAQGRGGSMHLYSDRLLGGFGIVGGHVPVAIGAAFTIKYLNQKSLSICFLGDGAVAQGAVHESLNLASLWDLPCLIVIENNQWGMGTAVERALCMSPIAEKLAPAYNMSAYSVDGMDYLSCYGCFEKASKEVMEKKRPVLIEAFTQRFKGHSISDPGLYRSKEELQKAMKKDPIAILATDMLKAKLITEKEIEAMSQAQKEIVIEAMEYALKSPEPDPITLEEGVFCAAPKAR